MKVSLTTQQAINTLSQVTSLLQRENNSKLNYALIKNKKKLESILKPKYDELHKLEIDRTNLCIRFCTKDANGKPITVNNSYQGLEPGVNEEFDNLFTEYKDNKQKILDEWHVFDCFEIDPDLLPPRMVGLQQEAIEPFIKNSK